MIALGFEGVRFGGVVRSPSPVFPSFRGGRVVGEFEVCRRVFRHDYTDVLTAESPTNWELEEVELTDQNDFNIEAYSVLMFGLISTLSFATPFRHCKTQSR